MAAILALVFALVFALGFVGAGSGFAEVVETGDEESLATQAASAGTERSQWELQMKRKWTMGRAAEAVPGSIASTPSSSKPDDEGEPQQSTARPQDSLGTYMGPVERIPSISHVSRRAEPVVLDPVTEFAEEGASPAVDEPTGMLARSDSKEAPPSHHAELRTARGAGVAQGTPSLFPQYVVVQTLWHPKSERRSARIVVAGGAPLRLQEGDRVGELKIETIELSGVVFTHAGGEIRRSVGQQG